MVNKNEVGVAYASWANVHADSVDTPQVREMLKKAFKAGWAYSGVGPGAGSSDLRSELEASLAELPEAIKACKGPTDRVCLTSDAFGGGGQGGHALREEMRLLGTFVKLAGCYGKDVMVISHKDEA